MRPSSHASRAIIDSQAQSDSSDSTPASSPVSCNVPSFRVLPLLTIKLAPDDTVSVLANAIVLEPSTIGCGCGETLGTVTSEAAVGRLPQDQLVAVNQLELVVPVQVFDEDTIIVVATEFADTQLPL